MWDLLKIHCILYVSLEKSPKVLLSVTIEILTSPTWSKKLTWNRVYPWEIQHFCPAPRWILYLPLLIESHWRETWRYTVPRTKSPIFLEKPPPPSTLPPKANIPCTSFGMGITKFRTLKLTIKGSHRNSIEGAVSVGKWNKDCLPIMENENGPLTVFS